MVGVLLRGDVRQNLLNKNGQRIGQRGKAFVGGACAFLHIKTPAHFYLQGVHVGAGAAVMACNVSASIGVVSGGLESQTLQCLFCHVGQVL